MFHASVDVQLPVTLPQPTSAIRRLVDLLLTKPGDPQDDDAATLRGSLTGNLTVFEALLRSFGEAGFDDVIAIVVDGKPVYVDMDERMRDLELALEGVVRSGALADGFAVMRTTFRRRQDGLKVLGELRCHPRRAGRADETRVQISARPLDIDPTEEEGPVEYAARVRAYLADADRVEAQRQTVAGIAADVEARIEDAIPGCTTVGGGTVVRFISPGMRQLGRMRHLGFRSAARRTVYCSLPSYERVGPYDDPLNRHYYSPYQDLFHWIAVGEVLAGQLPTGSVEVVTTTGRLLFHGDDAAGFDAAELAVSRDVVRVSEDGRLKIDESVPEVGTLHPAEAGSPHTRGWGGEAWAEDGDDEVGEG